MFSSHVTLMSDDVAMDIDIPVHNPIFDNVHSEYEALDHAFGSHDEGTCCWLKMCPHAFGLMYLNGLTNGCRVLTCRLGGVDRGWGGWLPVTMSPVGCHTFRF